MNLRSQGVADPQLFFNIKECLTIIQLEEKMALIARLKKRKDTDRIYTIIYRIFL